MAANKVDPLLAKRADKMADLSEEAAGAIEMAGRGLAQVFGQVKGNTPDMSTIYNLATVQQYIAEAQVALLERERHANPPDGKLLVTG